MQENVPSGYEKDAYKKSVVLMTEARLYLQNKYRKKVTFVQTDESFSTKEDMNALLKKNDSRFLVSLTIKIKAKKKNLEKVLYNLVIFDGKYDKSKTIKTKAIIKDKKIVKISQGDMKSSARKIAKFLKKK